MLKWKQLLHCMIHNDVEVDDLFPWQSAYLCVWPLRAVYMPGTWRSSISSEIIKAYGRLLYICSILASRNDSASCACAYLKQQTRKNFIRSFQNATSSFYVICFFMDTWTCRFQLHFGVYGLVYIQYTTPRFRNIPTSWGDNLVTASKDAYFSNTLFMMEGVLHNTYRMHAGAPVSSHNWTPSEASWAEPDLRSKRKVGLQAYTLYPVLSVRSDCSSPIRLQHFKRHAHNTSCIISSVMLTNTFLALF